MMYSNYIPKPLQTVFFVFRCKFTANIICMRIIHDELIFLISSLFHTYTELNKIFFPF